MEIRLLLLCLACLFAIVSSTHFAYGTYQWDRTNSSASKKQYRFQIELAFRRSFPWPAAPPGSSIPPNEGNTVNVGSVLWFYPMGDYSGKAVYNFAIQLLDKVNYINDDWFSGTQTVQLVLSTYLTRDWRHFYSECCRLSSIKDKNNDTPWSLTGIINQFGLYSPRVTGLPRIWFSLKVPNLYTIPVVHPLNRLVTYRYAIKPESALNNQYPIDPVAAVAKHTVTTTNLTSMEFQLNSNTGDCVWTPQATGLYALGFIIEEICPPSEGISCAIGTPQVVGTKDGNNGATDGPGQGTGHTGPCCTRVPFDFIFAVVPDCNVNISKQTGCAVPPYFYMPFPLSVDPAWRQWNFTRGIQGTFQVCARNDDKSQTQIDIDHAIFPDHSVWVVNYISNPSCYFYSWTPGLTDVDTFVCFFATSRPNMEKSRGQYCIKLHILPGNCIQLSGIIRDFHVYHTNMNKSYSDALEFGISNWVDKTLSNIWKPVFIDVTPAPKYVNKDGLQTSPTNPNINRATQWGFYDWYTTDDPDTTESLNGRPPGPRNLATPTQQLFCSGIVANNDQIFTFLQSAFFPIDNRLFGNEGDDHNYYFTYELNTYFQYNPGQIFKVQSDDDLFVFIDGHLPEVPVWNLYGIKTDDNSTTPPQAKGYTIDVRPLATTYGLKANETYRCDIFYANRMRRFPYLRIDITNTTLCDALSVSGYQFNYANFASTTNRAKDFYLTSSTNNPAKFMTYTSLDVIQLTDRNTANTDSYAAVWFGDPATQGTKVKASHGFVMEFTFAVIQATAKKGPPGMAVVFAADKLPSGASGPNLGYAGNVNFAVELDMNLDGTMNDKNTSATATAEYSEIAFHLNTKPKAGFTTAPPYGANSASESGSDSALYDGAAYNQDKTMFLNMQNGTWHTVRIEYQPGLSDFSDPLNPIYAVGWMRVFVKTQYGVQLAPFTQYQLPGKAMSDLLGGSCYLGITAGLNAQTGLADIYIKDWNFKFVPTNPQSTSYLVDAQNIIAGNQWCVIVQAKDACNNLITVGGESDQFKATYAARFCDKTPVTMAPFDNNNGSYTFCYNPVIAGSYEIKITFAGVPIDQGKQQLFEVIHAPADPLYTEATFGELADCFHSPKYCMGVSDQGIFVARFNNKGQLIKATPNDISTWGLFYDMSGATTGPTAIYDGGLAAFTAYVGAAASTDYLAIAIVGDITDTTTINNIKAAANSVKPAPTAMKNFASGDTYAYIGSVGTALVNSSCGSNSFCENKTQTGTAAVSARGTDSSTLVDGQPRRFTIKAQSANKGCGPYSRINGFYDDVRRPAGQNNVFSLIARDRFGNLCDDAETSFQPPIWNPDFTVVGGNRPAGTLTFIPSNSRSGYYQWQFLSYRAGKYQVNFLLNGQNIKSSPYTVTITPGLANVTTSSGTGPAMTTSVAGENATFTLNLADKVNNSKNYIDQDDKISGSLYRYSNGVLVQTIPITLVWVDDPASNCQLCLLQASYNATVASTVNNSYVLNFTINGETRTFSNPNIVPGPLYPALCTIDVSALPPYNPAGTPVLFTIQAKDRFNNLRTVPNVLGDTFVVNSNTTKSGPITVSYAGSGGIYNAQFKPKIKGTLDLAVVVVATGQDPALPAAGSPYPVGTKSINITPGPADPYWSYLADVPVQTIAGVYFNYSIISFDEFGNKRDNEPFKVGVAGKDDYVLRSYIPPAGDSTEPPKVTITPPFSDFNVTGNFSIQTNATVAGFYTLKVQTGLASTISDDVDGISNSLSNSSFKTPYSSVKVVPAPTWGPRTLYEGPGIYGGKQGTIVSFTLTAFDLYGNQIADWHDIDDTVTTWPQHPFVGKLFSVDITGVCRASDSKLCIGQAAASSLYSPATTGNITAGAVAGTYTVTYRVPPNDKGDYSPWQDFNITIKHTGGSVYYPYTCFPWQVVIPAVAAIAPIASCAKLNYTNETAGTMANWRIDDVSCNDGKAIYTTPSFLVTLTRVAPADSATITPIKVVCSDPTCGTNQSTNSQFNVSFLPTVNIGRFRIRVYAYGYLETNYSSTEPGLLVDIGPGPVYPPACTVVGFPGKVVAGGQFPFSVALSDQWFHPITVQPKTGIAYTVRANATGPSGATTPQTITLTNAQFNSGNGNYTFSTNDGQVTKAGQWNIQILEDTSKDLTGLVPQIGGKFLTLTVVPGPVDSAMTFATFPDGTLTPGALQVPFSTAGDFGFFTVSPKDKYGNDLPFSDDYTTPTTNALTFSDNAVATPPSVTSKFVPSPGADPNNPLNLIYTVSYNATKIADNGNIITVKVNNQAITGDSDGAVPAGPYAVLVNPARISGQLSTMNPNTPTTITAGDAMTFTLNAVDIFGNKWYSDKGQSLNALLTIPGVNGGSPTTVQAGVTGGAGGVYTFTVPGTNTRQASGFDTSANQYKFDNTLSLNYINGVDSQLLTGSGGLTVPTFAIQAGPTDPTQTAMVETPYPLMAGSTRNYTVITVDQYGNRRWLGKDDIVDFIFYDGNVDCSGETVSIDVTSTKFSKPIATKSLGQGLYQVTFSGSKVGIYTINVTVQPVPANPSVTEISLPCPQVYKLIQQVIPGFAYPPNCWYTVSPCNNVSAGSKLDFFLQINDKFNNSILRSGTQWAIGFYNAPGPYTAPSVGTTLALSSSTPAAKFDKVTEYKDTDTPPIGGVRTGWTMPAQTTWLTPMADNGYNGSQSFTPPEAEITVKDFGNSSYAFSVQVYKKGLTGIVISVVNDTGIWVVVPPPFCFTDTTAPKAKESTVRVVPGAPRQFLPYPPPIFLPPITPNSVTAAIPNNFTLQAKDFYGNDIDTSTHYYQIELQDISNGNGYTMNVIPGTTVGGLTPVSVESAWHGNFSLSITLYPNSDIPGADNSPVNPPVQNVYVQHATCAFPNTGLNYRCPDRTCVSDYSKCSLAGDSCTSMQVWCGGTTCADAKTTCAATLCTGLTKCPDGHCTSGACPPVPKCGSGYVACSPSGLCRQSQDDCPSPVVCAPGYMLCPDAVSCARTQDKCDQRFTTPCDAGTYRCATGECAHNLDDCPTPVSCGAGKVLCATDGSCRTDRTQCPDQYLCYDPAPIRCSSGVCVNDKSQCPPSVTCPSGFVKCEDGRCAEAVAACRAAVTCPYNQTRCPDGSCTHNLLFCATPRSCPESKPLLCWDGSCEVFGSECSFPQACPTTAVNCPGGSCAKEYGQCPTLTRCPADYPVLCNDGSCQINNDKCTPDVPDCAIQTPIRCADGQSCRAQLSDCPSIVTCQDYKVKCSDGTCAVASDKCPVPIPLPGCPAPNVTCRDGKTCALIDACPNICPDPLVLCAGGECASSYDICPTHVTCPFGYAKCTDGSCHDECPTNYQQCPQGTVTCPQASAGTQCAPTLVACPTSFICPYPSTVRCSDTTCALTAEDCPKPPKDDDYITNKVPCADGTYAADQQSCPTPVTCPPDSPYKCYDSTCKVALADCPVPTPCPRDANDNPQYRCSNGACSQFPWDTICTSQAQACPDSKPFQCPSNAKDCPTNALDCCRATSAECGAMDNPALDCNKTTNPTTGFCPICPTNWYYCQTGTCAKSALDCEVPVCPASLPWKCDDGLCTDVAAHCNRPSGCPYDKPTKCGSSGACVVELSKCPTNVPDCPAGYSACPSGDGSCAKSLDNCLPASGCGMDTSSSPSVQLVKCYDGSCARNCTNPTPSSTEDPPAACPTAYPYKCADGFCSKSLATCPYPSFDANCSKINGTKPFQCAIGTCVVSSTQCPPLYPCNVGQIRCGDGSCRADYTLDPTLPTCPRFDSCPTGTKRCDSGDATVLGSGLCVSADADPSLCQINVTTGCPGSNTKCANGQCVTAGSSCDAIPDKSGCPADAPNKCPNGACKALASDCPLPDGCPQGQSRCPYGECKANPSDCSGTAPDPSIVKCGDGSWAKPADCPGLNGCPVSTPFRCANGNCSATNALAGGCPPTPACASNQYLCASGSCESSSKNCPSVAPCTGTQVFCPNVFKCLDTCPPPSKYCPSSSSSLLCAADGTCAFNLAQCKANAGGQINQNCQPPKVRCIDETCVGSVADCITRAIAAHSASSIQGACGSGQVMCADGSCRGSERDCGIIPRCPFGQFRCPNGTCAAASNPTVNPCDPSKVTSACGQGYGRCEDGTCREIVCRNKEKQQECYTKCLEYDGCGLQYPYHCGNRECGKTINGCATAALGNPVIKPNSRRLLASTVAVPCTPNTTTNGFCMSMVKAAQTIITVDTTESSVVAIALDPNNIPRLSLSFSSGSFVLTDGSTITGFGIRPVGESRMRFAVNEIHASRRIQFGDFLPFSTTVLSPAFECQVDRNVKEPFNINVTVQAYFDRRVNVVNESDICLARLIELPGFTTWRCLFPSGADRDFTGPYYVKKNPKLPVDQVESVFNRCTPQASDVTGIQATANATAYAFIWAPIPKAPVAPEGPDVIQKNIVWIILGVLLGIAGLVLLTYCAFRLYRYRNKYKEQKEEADRLQEEVENMRQFGGEAGNKDDQVNMTANPLAVQLKDVQAKFNEEDMKLQQAEADLRKQEGEIRQEHIRNMRENRDQLASQLEKLKRQLAETQASNQPKATYEDNDGGASYTTDEPVREEFDGGSSGAGAQPSRKKRELN